MNLSLVGTSLNQLRNEICPDKSDKGKLPIIIVAIL